MFYGQKTIVNLTPHEVACLTNDTMIRIPPSGKVVRVNSQCESFGSLNGIPVVKCVESVPIGIPAPVDGKVYLVSSVVAKAVKRNDVLSPDTSDDGVIRDGNGYIIGVKRLQCFVHGDNK